MAPPWPNPQTDLTGLQRIFAPYPSLPLTRTIRSQQRPHIRAGRAFPRPRHPRPGSPPPPPPAAAPWCGTGFGRPDAGQVGAALNRARLLWRSKLVAGAGRLLWCSKLVAGLTLAAEIGPWPALTLAWPIGCRQPGAAAAHGLPALSIAVRLARTKKVPASSEVQAGTRGSQVEGGTHCVRGNKAAIRN
ncbi:hypothetical protein D3C86_1180210 [compost metagenome]